VHSGFFAVKNINIAIKEYKEDVVFEDVIIELKNLQKIDKSYPFILNCLGFYSWLEKRTI
jgi:hypothetical protein